jgi:hypothetical protein
MEDTMPNTTESSTAAVANELVDLCRAGRNDDAIEKLYSEKIVSIEPIASGDMPAEQKGLDAVRGKNRWWAENMVVHSTNVAGPFIGDGEFAVYFNFETTFKPTGQRSTMKEMAKYTVADGKIVKEEFFYAPQT